jgi:hypothetical protein
LGVFGMQVTGLPYGRGMFLLTCRYSAVIGFAVYSIYLSISVCEVHTLVRFVQGQAPIFGKASPI